jgi:hypothetical protein
VSSVSLSFSDNVLNFIEDEPEVKMDVFGHMPTIINPCLLLITPNATVDFT